MSGFVFNIVGAAGSLALIRLLGQVSTPLWMESGAYMAFVTCLIGAVVALWRTLQQERKDHREYIEARLQRLEEQQAPSGLTRHRRELEEGAT